MDELSYRQKPHILFDENRETFNRQVAEGLAADFSHQNLSDLNLRGFNLSKANLTGAYLRGADLRGVDLSGACLHGASLKNAHISGCLFPPELSAEEIRLSVEMGTRLRHIRRRTS